MTDKPRLIEYAFPLKQASLDSAHDEVARKAIAFGFAHTRATEVQEG